VLKADAVQLFMARARAARPNLAVSAQQLRAIAEICRRLDGLPLAIELPPHVSGCLTPKCC
jgi:predicted ATPase